MNIFKNKLLISWLGLAVIGFACQPSQDTLSTPTGAIKNSGVSAADVQPTQGITPDPTIPSTTPSFNILAQNEGVVVYTFTPDDTQPLDLNLCVWSQQFGLSLARSSDADVNWFINALISQDNSYLIYAQYLEDSFAAELIRVDLGSMQTQTLLGVDDFFSLSTDLNRALPLDMYWIADGSTLLFNNSSYNYGGGHLDDLHALDISTGELTTLLVPGQGGRLTPSPDGKWMAVANPSTIKILNLQTMIINEKLVFEPVVTFSDRPFYPQVVWLADSSSFKTAIPSSQPFQEDAFLTVHQIFTDKDGALQINQFSTGSRLPNDPIYFSPDLAWMAFEGEYTPAAQPTKLHLAELASGSALIIGNGVDEIRFSRWLDDRGNLMFWRRNPENVTILNTSGQTPNFLGPLTTPRPPSRPWEKDCTS